MVARLEIELVAMSACQLAAVKADHLGARLADYSVSTKVRQLVLRKAALWVQRLVSHLDIPLGIVLDYLLAAAMVE